MSAQRDSRRPGLLFILKVMLAVLLVGTVGLLGFARFGLPIYMPQQVFRLAQALKNPRIQPEVPVAWVKLCQAWGSWLGFLEQNAPRLLETEELWAPDDALRADMADFYVWSLQLRPASLVPEAAGEKDFAVLALSPPPAALQELQLQSTIDRVATADRMLTLMRANLENWPRWKQLRSLENISHERGFDRLAAALAPHLPPQRGSSDYHSVNTTRTMTYFDRLARDQDGMLRLSSRWSEFSHLSAQFEASGDPELQAMPRRLIERLTDQPTLAEFASSLDDPLEEMRRVRPAPLVAKTKVTVPIRRVRGNVRSLDRLFQP